MKCIVIESEGVSSRSLTRALEKLEDIEIVSTVRSGLEAQKVQDRNAADLLLVHAEAMDLQYLKQSVQDHLPQIIFVSNGRDLPEVVYRYNATDFLSFPLSPARLSKSIDRARLRKRILQPSQPTEELFVRNEAGMQRVKFEDIVYIERVEIGSLIKTTQGTVAVDWDLAQALRKISDQRFHKVNRNFVVNLTKVDRIEATSLVIENRVLTISRSSRPMLEHMMKSV